MTFGCQTTTDGPCFINTPCQCRRITLEIMWFLPPAIRHIPFRVFHRNMRAPCIQDAWTLSHAEDVTCKDTQLLSEPTLSVLCYPCKNEHRSQQKSMQFVWLETLLNHGKKKLCSMKQETPHARVHMTRCGSEI
jgi:hypothetical protein